jgi:hypothetical protein
MTVLPPPTEILVQKNGTINEVWYRYLSALQTEVNTFNSTVARGFIKGLTLSNNVADATNDIDIAAGAAGADANGYPIMDLSSAFTKRLDAAWAVGSGNGGRMSAAAIANTTYHVWLIKRKDTGVVDVGFDVSATSPTMPTGYHYKRRIGSIVRLAGSIKAFWQNGDVFIWQEDPTTDFSVTAAYPYALTTFTLPTGIMVQPIFTGVLEVSTVGTESILYWSDGRDSGNLTAIGISKVGVDNQRDESSSVGGMFTNTSAQVYVELIVTGSTITFCQLRPKGWIDDRGRD